MEKLKQYAEWLRPDYPSVVKTLRAAESLLEGLEETFHHQPSGLEAPLYRCLATTNLIESPQSGVRQKIKRVSRWRNGLGSGEWQVPSDEKVLALAIRHSSLVEELPQDHGGSRPVDVTRTLRAPVHLG